MVLFGGGAGIIAEPAEFGAEVMALAETCRAGLHGWKRGEIKSIRGENSANCVRGSIPHSNKAVADIGVGGCGGFMMPILTKRVNSSKFDKQELSNSTGSCSGGKHSSRC